MGGFFFLGKNRDEVDNVVLRHHLTNRPARVSWTTIFMRRFPSVWTTFDASNSPVLGRVRFWLFQSKSGTLPHRRGGVQVRSLPLVWSRSRSRDVGSLRTDTLQMVPRFPSIFRSNSSPTFRQAEQGIIFQRSQPTGDHFCQGSIRWRSAFSTDGSHFDIGQGEEVALDSSEQSTRITICWFT